MFAGSTVEVCLFQGGATERAERAEQRDLDRVMADVVKGYRAFAQGVSLAFAK